MSARRKIRRTTPYSFARVAAYRRSNAAWSPLATAAISHTNSAGVSICGQESPCSGRWPGRPVIATVQQARALKPSPKRARPRRYGQTLRKLPRSDAHRGRAHRADAVKLGLLARIVGAALALLVALVEQL